MQAAEGRPVGHVGFIDAARCRAVDVPRMDAVIVLEPNERRLVKSGGK